MKTEAELEQKLSEPSEQLIEDLRNLEGDLILLGVGGKMGPSLARLAKRACLKGNITKKIIGVSRFSDPQKQTALESFGIKTIRGDLLDENFRQELPAVENVIYLAGQKFGTSGNQAYTWAMNTYLPGRVAEKFKDSRIVAFSTGNVYPLTEVTGKGADENTPPEPIGEYAQSCLGRERIFDFFSQKHQTPLLLYRLNYALDLRYGVLNDIASKVWKDQEVDLSMGYVNVIWQGDANEYALRSLLHGSSPPNILNVTGPETLSVKWLAECFGQLMEKKPRFASEPQPTALLSDSTKMQHLLGPPKVDIHQMIRWTVDWMLHGGKAINKPTHFQIRDGKF